MNPLHITQNQIRIDAVLELFTTAEYPTNGFVAIHTVQTSQIMEIVTNSTLDQNLLQNLVNQQLIQLKPNLLQTVQTQITTLQTDITDVNDLALFLYSFFNSTQRANSVGLSLNGLNLKFDLRQHGSFKLAEWPCSKLFLIKNNEQIANRFQITQKITQLDRGDRVAVVVDNCTALEDLEKYLGSSVNLKRIQAGIIRRLNLGYDFEGVDEYLRKMEGEEEK